MSEFKPAIDFVLENEGIYSDNASDPGGQTKYGLTLLFLRRVKYLKPIKELTLDEAIEIYKTYIWNLHPFDMIVDQGIATKVFDMTVNMGPFNSFRVLQRACNKLLLNPELEVDGVFGTKTLNVINENNPSLLLTLIKKEAAQYYQAIVDNNPNQKLFLKGWLARAAR